MGSRGCWIFCLRRRWYCACLFCAAVGLGTPLLASGGFGLAGARRLRTEGGPAFSSIDISEFTEGGSGIIRHCASAVALGTHVYAAPTGSAFILDVDTEAGTASGIATSSLATGTWKWGGGCAVGTHIYWAPLGAAHVLILDTTTRTLRGLDTTPFDTGYAGGIWKWGSAAAVGSKVYMAPVLAHYVLVVDAATDRITTLDPFNSTGAVLVENNWFPATAISDAVYMPPMDGDVLCVN